MASHEFQFFAADRLAELSKVGVSRNGAAHIETQLPALIIEAGLSTRLVSGQSYKRKQRDKKG